MTDQELKTIYKELRLTREEIENADIAVWEDEVYQEIIPILDAQIAKILQSPGFDEVEPV